MSARHLPRSVLTFVVMIPATAYYATVVSLLALRRRDDPRIENVVRGWAAMWFRVSGASLTISGQEHVQNGRSYVVVSNHRSAFDIMAHFLAIPLPIRYLAKKELFRIPIFGQALRLIGIVEVDRQAGTSIHQHINKSAREAIRMGRSLIIYPEGTRPRDGEMRPFKKGAFTIASSMELPVLPTVITGSRSVWRPGGKMIHPGDIHVEIFPAIETNGLERQDVTELAGLVHDQIAQAEAVRRLQS
jgi:1-acyl-sn-glycerol-3-phosphate acyltransferase